MFKIIKFNDLGDGISVKFTPNFFPTQTEPYWFYVKS